MTRVPIPGGRDVRATLDDPAVAGDGTGDSGSDSTTDTCVVACPPHPQHGGSRSDPRLRAVTDALGERGVASLRFDYGPWDEGRGERRDAANAVRWADDRYDQVGLFGYSFGGAVALLGAAEPASTRQRTVAAVAALAPAARLRDGSDVRSAVDRLDAPTQVVVGERDDTVDWRPVAERVRAAGHTVERLPADHHFVGRRDRVGELVADWFVTPLG